MSSTDTDTSEAPEPVAETTEDKPKLVLEVNIDKTSACQRHVTVTIQRPDIDRYFKEAFDDLKPKAEVPGFRPGRAPRKLVESRFRDQVSNQVKGSLLMDSMSQINDDHKLSPISEPDFEFDAVDLPEEGSMTFEFDIEVRPEFDLPDWEGLKLDRPIREYSDKEVQAELEQLLRRFGKTKPHDGPIDAKTDRITVSVTCKHDDTTLLDGEEIDVPLQAKLSFSDATVEGFDKLMLGAAIGDTRSTKATVTQEAEAESLRGSELDVSFRVVTNSILELPEMTPSFLDEIGGFADEEEVRDAVRKELERQVGYRQNQQIRQQITAVLLESAEWELPPDLLKRQFRRELERAVLELRAANFTDDVIQAHSNRLKQNALASTQTALKEHFILERIAEDKDLDVAPEDYDMEVQLIAAQSRETPRRVRARLEKQGQMDTLRNQILERKVIELICEKAVFNDIPLEETKEDTFGVDIALSGAGDTEIPEAKHGGDAEPLRQSPDRT